ncbi:MAG: DinB family protein [Acidobacteriota bacterium]|nr:DinB family protein [Acidobacteriota bacterium]
MRLFEPIIAELQHEAATTRKMLERVPPDAFAWQPHEKSMTLGRLASHIVEMYSFTGPILTQDELDFANGNYEPFAPADVAELLAMFDKNVADSIVMLRTQTDDRLLASWRMRSGEQVFFEMPRVAVIRSFMLNHIVHHRGQLSVYLRLQNVPLPPIYGPTADEPSF